MQACVTIAPSGLSASFDINLPVSKSQTPTQSLVTVTAKLPSSAKLFYNVQSESRNSHLFFFFYKITLTCLSAVRACRWRELARKYCWCSTPWRFYQYSTLQRYSNFRRLTLPVEWSSRSARPVFLSNQMSRATKRIDFS